VRGIGDMKIRDYRSVPVSSISPAAVVVGCVYEVEGGTAFFDCVT
jgi:hypothetical protein